MNLTDLFHTLLNIRVRCLLVGFIIKAFKAKLDVILLSFLDLEEVNEALIGSFLTLKQFFAECL